MALAKRVRNDWQPSQIVRSRHGLSTAQPIHGSVHSHLKRDRSRFDMHWELEFGVVLSGSMQREYEGWKGTLRAGDVWFCGMWEPHGWRVMRTPCEVAVLVILPQMLVNMRFDEAPDLDWLAPFNAPPGARPQTSRSARSEIIALARRFGSVSAFKPPQNVLWKRLLLMQILLLLHRDWKSPLTQDLPASTYQRINTAVELVFGSRELVTAQQAATRCGMSRNHLNAVFEKLMGLSFARFALRYRLSQTASALLLSERPVKSIAAEWGFTDASHLHHCFYRHYGCSPRDYRLRKLQTRS
jgi:AraC-like DNA-binding protein